MTAERAPVLVETAGPRVPLLARATESLRSAGSALWLWFRGATGSQRYENYLRHAQKHGCRPLSEKEFYLEDESRRYSRPNRCC
jgi:uncharacterized short protein YbdD (DUF466 family)